MNEKVQNLFMKCEEVADHLREPVYSAKTLELEQASILDGSGSGSFRSWCPDFSLKHVEGSKRTSSLPLLSFRSLEQARFA